ncbi:MAG: hypothetical protein AAFU73_14170 [Planctomycetota bacterium]
MTGDGGESGTPRGGARPAGSSASGAQALIALVLVVLGLGASVLAVRQRAAAEPTGAVPAELVAGARAEVRTSVLAEVTAGSSAAARLWLYVAGALLGVGCGLLVGRALFGAGRRADRFVSGLAGLVAAAAATALVLALRDAAVAAEARGALMRLSPAVLLPALLAARPRR